MSRHELTLRSILSDIDIDGILEQFADGKWKWKDLVGEHLHRSEKSPCIKVRNWKSKHRGLYCYQAVWLIAFGAVPVGFTISHHCSCKKTHPSNNDRVSPCVNIHHMSLEPDWMNSGRTVHQNDLRTWRQRNLWNSDLKGPQFLDSVSDSQGVHRQRCHHNPAVRGNESCFINCGRLRKIKGLFWYNPPPKLLRNTNRRPIAFTFDMRNRER